MIFLLSLAFCAYRLWLSGVEEKEEKKIHNLMISLYSLGQAPKI
jgi:hypothetical protein